MLIYFMAIWNILWIFGIFCDHLLDIVLIWYIFPVLVSCTKKNLATLTRLLRHSGGYPAEAIFFTGHLLSGRFT
jgi:hypothetical protein